MKKILLGIIIGSVLILGGCMAMLGGAASSVNDSIEEMENETAKMDEVLKEMTKDINWEVKKDTFSTNIIGEFENTSEEVIDYMEFEYKLIDKDGVVIEKSFTNETDISPGEKRKIEIYCSETDFETYEINVKSDAF